MALSTRKLEVKEKGIQVYFFLPNKSQNGLKLWRRRNAQMFTV